MREDTARANVRLSAFIRIAALAILMIGLAVAPARAFETSAPQAILVDFETGTILFEKNADELMPPASMSKMMTVYMVFERLKEGRLGLDDTVTVSDNAWRKGGAASGGSTMFLQPGSEVTIEDLLLGIIVQSGNDASIAVAEAISGSEAEFAEAMTERAREMGLDNSTFTNATGLPDERHRTTARDLALLAMRTIADFPEYYDRYYGVETFTHNGIRQGNRNPLLDEGADGLKTGHTSESGYGLVASAEQGEEMSEEEMNALMLEAYRPLELNQFTVALEDNSLLERGLTAAGQMQGMDADTMRQQIVGFIGMGMMMAPPEVPQALLASASAALTSFVQEGGTLVISADPEEPVSMGAIIDSATAGNFDADMISLSVNHEPAE